MQSHETNLEEMHSSRMKKLETIKSEVAKLAAESSSILANMNDANHIESLNRLTEINLRSRTLKTELLNLR